MIAASTLINRIVHAAPTSEQAQALYRDAVTHLTGVHIDRCWAAQIWNAIYDPSIPKTPAAIAHAARTAARELGIPDQRPVRARRRAA